MLYKPAATTPTIPSNDNSALSAYQNSIASGTNFQWTHNTTSGAYAIVALINGHPGSPMTTAATVTTMTFGGQTMTSLGNIAVGSGGFIWVFGLPNAPGGSNTVSVTLTQVGDTFQGFGASFTYLNVASVGTLVTAAGGFPNVSMSVTSAVGNLVWAAAAVDGGSGVIIKGFNLNMNVRQQYNQNGPNATNFVAGDTPGASTVKINAGTSNNNICTAGLNLI